MNKLGTLSNIVDLSLYKKRFLESKFKKNYDRYLKLLPNEELEYEVNYLLDEFSGDNYGSEFFLKGEMILDEIADRVDPPLANSIQDMAKGLNQKNTNSTSNSLDR